MLVSYPEYRRAFGDNFERLWNDEEALGDASPDWSGDLYDLIVRAREPEDFLGVGDDFDPEDADP